MSESNKDPGTTTPDKDDHDLSQRLQDLSARAKTIRVEAGLEPEATQGRKNGAAGKMGLGGRVVTELVVGTCVGAGIGYGFDEWLDTGPWGLVGGLVLGFAGSIMTIYRVVRGYDEAVGLGRATRDGSTRKDTDDVQTHAATQETQEKSQKDE